MRQTWSAFLNYCFGHHEIVILVNLTYLTFSWNPFSTFFGTHRWLRCMEIFGGGGGGGGCHHATGDNERVLVGFGVDSDLKMLLKR